MVGLPQSQSIEMSALLAVAQCLGIMSTSHLFDKWGRRRLMIPSLLLASLCLALTGFCFIDIDTYGNEAVSFILAYLFFFGCGLSSGNPLTSIARQIYCFLRCILFPHCVQSRS